MTRLLEQNPLKVLVVEDNPGDFLLLKENIYLSKIAVSDIQLAECLESAKILLETYKPDIIFLDLYLPDSSGLDSFTNLKEYVTSSSVIILSGLSDTNTALEAIILGAQDYLAKGEFDEKLLAKTITYSIERKKNMETLREANERYSLVTRATHDLIWDWNLLTGEVYSDKSTAKNSEGFAPNTAIHDIDTWNRRIHPDDCDRWCRTIEKIKNSKDDFFELEYRIAGPNGNYRHIYDRGYVVRDNEGNALRMIGAAQDVTEKLRLESALRESQIQRQRVITEATIKGQENEREQLGRELHDNINQILATSKLYLDHGLSSSPIKEDVVRKSKEFISQAIEEIRRLSKSLLPPTMEEMGLITALNELLDIISLAGDFHIQRDFENFQEQALQKDQKLTIYRILQEQMNNIMKHAGAKNVIVSLHLLDQCDESNVELVIKDDGKGFNPSKKRNGVGLRNIISRAELFGGNVEIQSEPGHGCELKVIFPGKPAE
jgi:two-component system, NarL family, sensor histidine kinase UhpB